MSALIHIGIRTDLQWQGFTTLTLPANEKALNKAVSDYFNHIKRRPEHQLFVAFDEHFENQKQALLIKGCDVKSSADVKDSIRETRAKVQALMSMRP